MKTAGKNALYKLVHPNHNLWPLLLLALLMPGRACASDIPLMFQSEVLAKASPDECFFGIGNTNNAYSPTGIVCEACLQAGGKPKVNQGYVWGLTRAGDDFWIGTGANINSLVAGSYMGLTNPIINSAFVAEFGASALVRAGLVPAPLGDWRPPDIFVYNLDDHSLMRMDELMPAPAQALLQNTLGLRSAGTSAPTAAHTNGVVILAGPSLNPAGGGGIIMFVFDAGTRAFIQAARFTQYSNIRKWLLYNGVLYTAVTTTNGSGCVLRWINDSPTNSLTFTVVGNLDDGGAELAIHEGRMFVATWPGIEGTAQVDFTKLLTQPVGIYMSPVIPDGGLTNSHASQWGKVWNIQNYEKDMVCAAVTAMGALHSYGSNLYWGTMNVPGLNYYAHVAYFGAPANSNAMVLEYINSHRAVAIFRGSNFRDGNPPTATVELLYGETNLPNRDLIFGIWHTNMNAMGVPPEYGTSGFGNPYNTYTWTMELYKNQLFVGTMNEAGTYRAPTTNDGAGLFCFYATNLPAKPVSQHGVGNYANYGIRTTLSDSNSLYLGMANPMNLMTDTNGGLPLGGWELDKLTQVFVDQDWNNLPDFWETNYFGHSGVDPNADPDNDGFNNLQEFIAGTNPTNSNDFPAITTAVATTNQSVSLIWPGHYGRLYHVLQTSNFPANWNDINSVTGSDGTTTFTLPMDTNQFNFYRLKVELAPGTWLGP